MINKAETSAKAPGTNGGHQGKKRGDYEEDQQKNEEEESEREAENLEQRPSRREVGRQTPDLAIRRISHYRTQKKKR